VEVFIECLIVDLVVENLGKEEFNLELDMAFVDVFNKVELQPVITFAS
jgi:hypothetical protein